MNTLNMANILNPLEPLNSKIVSLDIETYSSVDLNQCGVYRYVEAPDFEVLLIAYSVDSSPVHVVDLARGEAIPQEIINALTDNSVIKVAFNANFERICLSRFLGLPTGTYLDPASWRCTMISSAYVGLPMSLGGAGAVLELEKQKLAEGKELVKYFCKPCKPTKTNGGRTRNLPEHDPEKWERFKAYNKRDVEVELQIALRLSRFPVPDAVWEEYRMDQTINDAGICMDMTLVEEAIIMDELSREALTDTMKSLTGLDNPNSVPQLKRWLAENGLETDSLDKKALETLIRTAPEPIRKVLELRQQLAKTSVRKYQAMKNAVCADGRIRGMFQFYGASRTGRWAGRLVQLQNLPQTHLSGLEQARKLVRAGDYEMVDILYDSVPGVLSELVRTALVPQAGHKFIVADYAAIEARVLAYLAGETWRTQAFVAGQDIYAASASKMFGVPVEKNGINGHLRQKGKIAELALGYGGSVGALKAMGALEMGLEEKELPSLVTAWRQANPNIVWLWWAVDGAIKTAITERIQTNVRGICFQVEGDTLFIKLPSGRRLAYAKPRICANKFGGESVSYEGVGGTKKWERLESFGAKFTENIVQAISRDILCNAMRTLRQYHIVGHVHDELIIECPMDTDCDSICEQMSQAPVWWLTIMLRADGYETNFYRKS